MAEGIRSPNFPLGGTLGEFIGHEIIGTTRSLRRFTRESVIGDIEAVTSSFKSGGGVIFTTKAQANASLNFDAMRMAWVILDPNPSFNGVYQKIGGAGSGSWSRLANLPYSFYRGLNSGAGTANAIVVTNAYPLASTDALIVFNITEDNSSSTVTVSFNGGTPLNIKTASGNNPASGGFVTGMVVAGYIEGANFRLLSDQATAAIVPAAEAAQAAAEDARDAALGAVPNVFSTSVAAIKALDTTTITAAYLKAAGREGQFVWKTGNFSSQIAADTNNGLYIKATAIAATSGAWVRVRQPGFIHADWFGPAKNGSTDDLAVLQAGMGFAVGGIFQLGSGQYKISDTLGYEAASNEPIWIRGVSEAETEILMAGTGFAIEYYGGTGAGAEARGGGVSNLKISKTGGGTCSGVDLANIYFGEVSWIDASGCGDTGFRITGRGGGDTDATYGLWLHNCRARSGRIGCQIRGDTSGSIVAAQISITDNDFAGNSVTAFWVSCVDQVFAARNIYVGSGHTNGGVENGRGNVFIEYFGGHVRNYRSEQCEYGNGTTGCTYDVIIDALLGGEFVHERHIRNSGEANTGAYLLGFSQTSKAVSSVSFVHDYIVASGSDPFTIWAVGGTTMAYDQNAIIRPQYVSLGGSVIRQASTSAFYEISETGSHTLNRPSDGSIFAFQRAGSGVGSISVTSSATAYNTSSDYRIKMNYAPIVGALDRMKTVKAQRGEFRVDPGNLYDYFIAHEIAEVVPQAVTGVKDGPEMQAVDYSKVVPLMWAAIQELADRVESLAAG